MFVGGMGRSGSTLVERLLGELPGVCSLGEVVHLWQRGLIDNERCGCGTPFRDCSFWHEVGTAAFGGWDALRPSEVLALRSEVDRIRFVPRLLRTRLSATHHARVLRYVQLYHRLYAAVAAHTGCRVVVDSSKHASLAACLRWYEDAELSVVHVLRDPRAVAHSWRKRLPRPEATSTSPEQEMARSSPARTAVHWSVQNRILSALAARGVPTYRVRYEDFAADPQRHVREVARFIGGVQPVGAGWPFTGSHTARLAPAHTVSGNPGRFTAGDVAVRCDETWQQQLSWRHRVVVSALTAPVRARYGY
ncbi:sulfotransferase [Lipingzhangella sp. LS1_29]|uniref:Sulfotransferase n=1 Tax=Lipingzhangella rawalii TaxID=2055835 RepID=A0ABU2H3D5_9ACTN|nr:sulfotransferase [Lipingzhangella rawalii]MDS1269812.1 sulfotransferase [Lipingzhangella rawalii]